MTATGAASRAPRSRRVRRAPILLLVAGALVAAAVSARDAPGPDAGSARAGASAAEADGLPAADAVSSSWYCTEGTAVPDGRADETVVVANLDDRRVVATVTVMAGGDAVPVSRTVRVGAGEEARVRVAEVLEAPEPGVVVEVVGGQAAVSHELRAGDDVAAASCARRAGTEWYFAGGTTVRGAEQYLALFDPFGDDAIVDVTFLTDAGVVQPASVQGLVVPRRTRVTIPVHELVPRQPEVAVQVAARTGRVVAERSMTFDGSLPEDAPARRGIALTAGVHGPTRSWTLPYGTTAGGGRTTLGIANFAAVPTDVEVEVLLDDELTLTPVAVSIPARGVASVDVSERVPPDTSFAVRVHARTVERDRPPVVVALLAWWPEGSATHGVAANAGSAAARRAAFALPEGALDGTVTLVNPGASPVLAELRVGTAGSGLRRDATVTVPAGGIATLDTGSLAAGAAPMLVVGEGEVVAGITMIGEDGAAMVASVPDFGGG